eukprot:scaffold550640_cov17-Prasinocladus_malaysianus.AAC.1
MSKCFGDKLESNQQLNALAAWLKALGPRDSFYSFWATLRSNVRIPMLTASGVKFQMFRVDYGVNWQLSCRYPSRQLLQP